MSPRLGATYSAPAAPRTGIVWRPLATPMVYDWLTRALAISLGRAPVMLMAHNTSTVIGVVLHRSKIIVLSEQSIPCNLYFYVILFVSK